MSLSLLFIISSIYLVLLGLGTLISPTTVMAGALDLGAQVLVDTLRGVGGGLIAAAVVNWLARNSEPSKARSALVIGNLVGFVLAAIFGILSVIHGYPVYGWILVLINILLAIGFFFNALSGTPAPAPAPVKASPPPEKPRARKPKPAAKRRR